jgi:hypothetical protein
VLLLVLLSSVASLMYKLMKLRTFPGIWPEHSRLIREKVKLVARAERLKMEVQATVMPESEGSDFDFDSDFDSDSDVGGNSGSVCSDTGSNCLMEGRATLQILRLRRCQLQFATIQQPTRLYRHRPTGQVGILARQHGWPMWQAHHTHA